MPPHSAVRLRSPFCNDSLHGATAIHTVTEAQQELFVRASARRAERRLFIPHRDFDRLWSLGLSGLLKHARIVLTPPRYLSAYVLNISFSTHLEE
jgi:hypothetical protein